MWYAMLCYLLCNMLHYMIAYVMCYGYMIAYLSILFCIASAHIIAQHVEGVQWVYAWVASSEASL